MREGATMANVWMVLVLVLLFAGHCVRAQYWTQGSEEPPEEEFSVRRVPIKIEALLAQCKGTYERPAGLTSWLVCWYDARNYHSVIGPRKVEMLNHEPFVALFYDVIHDSEIARLQQLGEPVIQMSGETIEGWLPVFHSNHQTYTLANRDDPVVKRLSQRTERMSGLSCDTAEDLKVIYNEVGAYKSFIVDGAKTSRGVAQQFAFAGNRLATVLFFMSDVDAAEGGGRIAFPYLGFSVLPQKGAAVFWYNLHDTGRPDERMTYSVCPLLADSRWMAKLYIHTRGNELRNPCRPSNAPKPRTVQGVTE
ncbi:prolyl 4-hydroxylase subunit alpha-1-like [Anopheles albimanus]|uniref:Prolyl 4-hydroxylase alpha subunit domain-containing protein n=1 Tax=Anopheles albimanus TaxID=7167 RepID=A0A182FQ31_ANOAL|nr:prolyl 4-hydroxylase subunit alpha-1-like [Anopheles albimanus]